jgi:hypothetical protein
MIGLIASLWLGLAGAPLGIEPPERIVPVDQVWSGHPVDFAVTRGADATFVAYYDRERRMTVAALPVGATRFTKQPLDSVTGWDSHNYIAMAVDADGHLHVIGNLHNDPLVYFRSTRAGDVTSLERVRVLVDERRERRMTYPVFIERRGHPLVLKYRDGGSGNGDEIYVTYDTATRAWRSLLDTPLVDGEGKRNAYFMGPTPDANGWLHLVWVWRDTPDAETNHDLSYARSRDLVHWEKSDGTPLPLPITLGSAEIVDPVPIRGGMINNNTVVGFDGQSRPVITYHKFDENGNTQIYLARRENKGWNSQRITDWKDFRWEFSGRGSLSSRVFVGPAQTSGRTHLIIPVIRDGELRDIRVRSRDLRALGEAAAPSPDQILAPKLLSPPGMILNVAMSPDRLAGLAWHTLPRNRDQPRSGIPAPTTLSLLVFSDTTSH